MMLLTNLMVTSMRTMMIMLLTNLMVTRTKGKTSIVVQLLRLLVRFVAQLKQDAKMKSCNGQLENIATKKIYEAFAPPMLMTK